MIHFELIIYLHIFIPELTNFGNLLLYTTFGTYVVLFPRVVSLFFEWLGYLGCQMNDFVSLVWMQNGRRKEILTQAFLKFVTATLTLHSVARIFIWFLCIIVSSLCPSSTQQFSLFPVRAIKCWHQGTAESLIILWDSHTVCFASWPVLLHGKKSQNET